MFRLLLKPSNRAYFGPSQQVASIEHAQFQGTPNRPITIRLDRDSEITACVAGEAIARIGLAPHPVARPRPAARHILVGAEYFHRDRTNLQDNGLLSSYVPSGRMCIECRVNSGTAEQVRRAFKKEYWCGLDAVSGHLFGGHDPCGRRPCRKAAAPEVRTVKQFRIAIAPTHHARNCRTRSRNQPSLIAGSSTNSVAKRCRVAEPRPSSKS